MTISMKSIRKFAYAAALTISSLNFTPATAWAQDARGHFVLPHEVHWQNVKVPAGDYEFSLSAEGPSEMLTLQKISGNAAGFMLVVSDTESVQSSGKSRIVLVSRGGTAFVSEMELLDLGMKLRFKVPARSSESATAKNAKPSAVATVASAK